MIKAGIIGGGGYTAGELIRILYAHPEVDIAFVYSQSQAGKQVYETHEDLLYIRDLVFTDKIGEADVLFLCQGHGKAIAFMNDHGISEETVVIDLGNDFRLKSSPDHEWIYGLPEINRVDIVKSKRVANCGCFATAIQLALLPLAHQGLLADDIHITAITGSTGAGQSLQRTTHFSWRNNNISIYKAFSHQHEGEIHQSLQQLQSGYNGKLRFLPHRGDFTRGILASIYTKYDGDQASAIQLYKDYYRDHPFTIVNDDPVTIKQVVNTNYCYLHVSVHDDMLLIQSVIDNLVKGASGQAVQNMNLVFGLKETTGLNLKPVAY